jgi:hypothetical protein
LLRPGFTVQLDARLLDLAFLCALALWLLLQLALSVLRDLLAVRSVFAPGSLRALLRWGLHALSARAGRLTLRSSVSLTLRYAAYRGLALAAVLGGELLLLALPGAGLRSAGVGLIVHQGALFTRLMLRGFWLSELAEITPKRSCTP